MIKFSNVTLLYPQSTTTVIENLSFEIAEGEMVLVMGHTGVGKSSLLRLINGLVPHHTGGILAGEISVDGISTRFVRPGALSGIVGIVGQNPINSFVADTVEEEIAFGMESLNFHPELMRKRVEEALDQVGLSQLRDRNIATLSGGEQQRVAIASALVMHPKVLVLDEPTSALDPIAAEEILSLLQRLVHDLSVTVIIAEHRLERVIGYVDRILLIDGDGDSALGLPEEVLRETNLVPPLIKLSRALNLPESGTNTREVRRATDEVRRSLPDFERPESKAGDLVIEISKVRFSYSSKDLSAKEALKGVSLALYAGEITALMGRNGAGKSSLIKVITGLITQSHGSAAIDGTPISDFNSEARARLVGYIPQDPGDILYLQSVAEECKRTDRDKNLAPGTTLNFLHKLLPSVSEGTHPRDLSEGERLTLVLAIVLVASPKVIILDEPTRGLDYSAKEKLSLLLKEAAEGGASILLATHDVELVAELADRTIFMADGEKVADGKTLDVLLASPAFAPQVSKVMSPRRWLTVSDVLAAQDLEEK
jgi:energy-coupling factor transport system ATP-binding protein